MNPDERERMAILCERIAKEKDPNTFDKLVRELNNLLRSSADAFTVRGRLKGPATQLGRPLTAGSGLVRRALLRGLKPLLILGHLRRG
jgi:hypothetical protein